MRLKSFIVNSGPRGTVEIPCFTCPHCSRVVIVNDQNTELGFCMQCFYPTCPVCAGSKQCVPFEKKIELYERSQRFRAQL